VKIEQQQNRTMNARHNLKNLANLYMVLHFVVPAVQVKVKFFADSKVELSKKKKRKKKSKIDTRICKK
jgi:hypothetical protein